MEESNQNYIRCKYDTILSNGTHVKCSKKLKSLSEEYCLDHKNSLFSLINRIQIGAIPTNNGQIDFVFKNLECLAYVQDFTILPLKEAHINFLNKKGIKCDLIKKIKQEKDI
jgi:hypothetical protein